MSRCAYTWTDDDGRKRQCRGRIDLAKLDRFCPACMVLIREGIDRESVRLRKAGAEHAERAAEFSQAVGGKS